MRYTNLRQTKSEEGHVSWYWRVAAICASCLILGGFLVLPWTFDKEAHLRTSRTAVGIFGIALVVAGFFVDALVCFGCRNWAFVLDHVFLTAVISSVVGFLTVPYCFIISTRFEWNTAALLTTIGSGVSAIIYTILYFFMRHRISRIQTTCPDRIDLMRRPSITSTTQSSYHTQNYFANHVANMYPAARTAAPSIVATTPEEDPLNEEELQRRHMSALLHKPEPYISPAASPFNRIEFNLDETEPGPPVHGYYAPSSVAASSSQALDHPSWRTRNNSWGADSQRRSTSREERRREIEMGRY